MAAEIHFLDLQIRIHLEFVQMRVSGIFGVQMQISFGYLLNWTRRRKARIVRWILFKKWLGKDALIHPFLFFSPLLPVICTHIDLWQRREERGRTIVHLLFQYIFVAERANMDPIIGKYRQVSSEGIEDFMKSQGVGLVKRKMAFKMALDQIFDINEDGKLV